MPHTSFQIVAAVVVGVLAAARLTRLICFDSYPPSAWLRDRWRKWTKDGKWAGLVDCPYCAAPYCAAAVLAAGEVSDYAYWWWIFCGWLAGSYLAAIVVVFDGEE
jgi:hypothetical protein